MLLGVLSFVDLAGGVVSFTHPACIRHSFGAQNTVTAHFLWEKNTRHLFFDKKSSSYTQNATIHNTMK